MSSHPSPAEPPFHRVAILGLGVMGGSLARALVGLEHAPSVTGWSPDGGDVEAAIAAGVVEGPAGRPDVSTGVETQGSGALARAAALADADLVVLAAPLRASAALMEVVAREAPTDATVTDVASLKAPMAEAARAADLGARWVGCHPMAGSEGSGFGASSADLYADAPVWIVAGDAEPERVAAVSRLWERVGARPLAIEADAHDRLMAHVSHLPQLASNALAEVLESAGLAADRLGPGGRDATRLAASNPDMWRDLLACAAPELVDALRVLSATTARLADQVERGDLDALIDTMTRTARWRDGA